MLRMLKKCEVAEVLRVSPRTVDRLIASGELPSVKIGGSRRIQHEALLNFISRHETDVWR